MVLGTFLAKLKPDNTSKQSFEKAGLIGSFSEKEVLKSVLRFGNWNEIFLIRFFLVQIII